MPELTIALCQAETGRKTIEQIMKYLELNLAAAARQNVQLMVTPELFLSGYGSTRSTKAKAQSQTSPIINAIGQLVAKYHVGLVLGYPEMAEGKLYNSALVFSRKGQKLHNYRKMAVANRYEKQNFSIGTGPEIFVFDGVRCSVLICYDVEFPELPRRAARAGAELILVPTALRSYWRVVADSVIPTRAYENGIFIAYCDYAATASSQSFSGASTIAGPDGQPHFDNNGQSQILVATINTSLIKQVRSDIRFLKDLPKLLLNPSFRD